MTGASSSVWANRVIFKTRKAHAWLRGTALGPEGPEALRVLGDDGKLRTILTKNVQPLVEHSDENPA